MTVLEPLEHKNTLIEVQESDIHYPKKYYCIHVHANEFKKDRKTLVLLHGYMSSSQHFDPVIKHFSNDFNIIAVDLRGHGSSEYPRNHSWTFDELACDIKEVICQKGYNKSEIIVVGSSLSTAVTIQLTKLYPNLINKIVLISPTTKFFVPPWLKVLLYFSKVLPEQLMEIILNFGSKILPKLTSKMDEEDFINGLISFHDIDIEVHKKIFFDALLNWEGNIETISIPTLIIVSIDDEIIYPSSSYEVHTQLENSKIVHTDGVKHQILISAADFVISKISEFLDETD